MTYLLLIIIAIFCNECQDWQPTYLLISLSDTADKGMYHYILLQVGLVSVT